VFAKQENDELGGGAMGIRIKFSGGKLKLCRFVERDEFLNAFKAASPAIGVETDRRSTDTTQLIRAKLR
jgi:hypothetical protein